MADGTMAISQLQDLTGLARQMDGYGEVLRALRAGEDGDVDGAWGSSTGLALAALADAGARTLVCVCGQVSQVEDLAEDIESFLGRPPAVFPSREHLPDEDLPADPTLAARLRVVRELATNPPPVLVTSVAALMEPVPSPPALERHSRTVRQGAEVDLEGLVGWLTEAGFQRQEMVELPGEFSVRGGILDVFPLDGEAPVRIELVGESVESIRQFDVQTQRSLGPVEAVQIVAGRPGRPGADADTCHLADCLPTSSWVALVEPGQMAEEARFFLSRLDDVRGLYSWQATQQKLGRFPLVTVSRLPAGASAAAWHLRVESVGRFTGKAERVVEELDAIAPGSRAVIACHNAAEAERLRELLAAGRLARSGRLSLVQGRLQEGFRLVEFDTLVIPASQLFRRYGQKRRVAKRPTGRAIESFLELRPNDYVVHVAHGIGLYRGTQILERPGGTEEYLVIEFREGTRVYVPGSRIDLVQKYVGGPSAVPTLSKVGEHRWQMRKLAAQQAVTDLAAELLAVQAARRSLPGIRFPPDSPWQREFEAEFPYEETPDQLATLEEIKRDMESDRPMDRLVCGDVGYGKTELAIRAAFKAVDFGKQVAVLVPTTVLAEQHFRTFSERLADYPFLVEVLSRFKTRAEQRQVLDRLRAGKIDIIIGTHRLIQPDVEFRDLGLVIIDEEQRFGVEHKERLKALRTTVDVLTLTATPIPRTLHMAMLGLRDISNLTTPPPDRLSIETRIARFDEGLIRHAVIRELNRNGQVYFVHNRVMDIDAIASRLARIVPEARLVIAHGQMEEHELARAMNAFVNREYDMLVATTIIESGLDIPNVNTIFINEADTYGLADLHQLRGRVGRYKHRAYAYLLVNQRRPVTHTGAERLKAIEEFTELGAGFHIAMRDLEIRGAGNLLGAQQSGHIAAVGYELYCQLLENAVRTLRQEPIRTPIDVRVDLGWPTYLPTAYVPRHSQRLRCYRLMRAAREPAELDALAAELVDRYGPLPSAVRCLLAKTRLALAAHAWQIAAMHIEDGQVVFSYRDGQRLATLCARAGRRLKIVSPTEAYLRPRAPLEDPEALAQELTALLEG